MADPRFAFDTILPILCQERIMDHQKSTGFRILCNLYTKRLTDGLKLPVLQKKLLGEVELIIFFI